MYDRAVSRTDQGVSRREILKFGALGTAAVALPLERTAHAQVSATRLPASRFPAPFTVPFKVPPVAVPTYRGLHTDYYDMTMRSTTKEILPGFKTEVWTYNGCFPGPTINNYRGRPAVVRHVNALPAKHPRLGYDATTSVHLHGSDSLPQYDGYASDITWPGQYKDYHYPNDQDARTLWYHDHATHHTAENAYMGLAAMYILHDDLEKKLPLPKGRYDVPLVIRDAAFDTNGQLLFDDPEHSGVFGDVILVNGLPWPVMKVERRKYRFRMLNASVSRGFKFALSTGDPFTFVGTDGGLMPHPQQATSFRHGIAERYEVVIDFAKYKIGQRVVLKNLGVKNSVNYPTTGNVMAFDVTSNATDTTYNSVPNILNPAEGAMLLTEAMATKTRRFEFVRSHGHWTINGKDWQDVIDSGYQMVLADPNLGDIEIWEFVNDSGGWWHPVHVHLVDFKILDRNGRPPNPWEIGGKDVVFVGENETVRLVMKFGPRTGRYMIHCHNLVHEDHDMMSQFRVDPPQDYDDPIYGDPARWLPAGLLGADDA
jgi:FtsP/CotA-like multicopper oxidase with cupredoxin domain